MRAATWTLAAGLGAALLVALAATWVAATPEGWWNAGYHRLFFASVWCRFDRWALWVIAVAAPLALWELWRRRRAPARVALVLVAVVLVARGLGALDAWRAGRGPNLLLISIDTLRADRLGTYGYPLPTSPGLDARLAAAGVVFEDAWSQSPKTSPSHMTLLTSLYPPVHGVTLLELGSPGPTLNPRVHTLAEVLKNAGYATGAFTGGAHMEHGRGFEQGFDVYDDEGYGRQLPHALSWMRHHRRRRFFAFFHTYIVHDPYAHPRRYVDLFDAEYQGPLRDAVRRIRAAPADWEDQNKLFWSSFDKSDARAVRFLSSLYDAGIRRMDEETLPPLLGLLDRLGLADETLVVLTSDHGEAFGEHEAFLHDDLYAGTLRVPLVLRFPGRLPAGARVPARVRLVDVMPTILELLGVPAPPAVQGRSLVPLLRGTPAEEAVAPSDYGNPERGLQSIRWQTLSYIADGRTETLFDTAHDPGEQRDIARDRPDAVAAMRARLARWRADCEPLAARFPPHKDGATPGPETVRRLRALGYVE